MNEEPRRVLADLVRRLGPAVAAEPRRCEGLLRDYCGQYRREISVLVTAAEEQIPNDLASAPPGTPKAVLLARLASRLTDHHAISADAARWAVNSWAIALGFAAEAELTAAEATDAAEVKTVPAPAAVPPTVIVSAAGAGQFRSVRAAIEAAPDDGRILVRPGVYHESLVIERPVEILGDGEAIIHSTDASCVRATAERGLVRGLTLRGRGAEAGQAFFAVDILAGGVTFEDCGITSDTLSVVAIHGGTARPRLSRCRIHDGADSGVYVFDEAAGRIEECEVYHNANVGIAVRLGGRPTVTRCRIFNGRNAGLVVWQGGAGFYEECEITGNEQAGVGISEGGDPLLRRCKIHGGANTGVFAHEGGRGRFEGCDIFANTEAEVAITHGANTSLLRCSIHGGRDYGVFVRDDGRALLQECHVFDHAASGVTVTTGGQAFLQRCQVNRNRRAAVSVDSRSSVRAEDCDLSANRLGAWQAERGAKVGSRGNTE